LLCAPCRFCPDCGANNPNKVLLAVSPEARTAHDGAFAAQSIDDQNATAEAERVADTAAEAKRMADEQNELALLKARLQQEANEGVQEAERERESLQRLERERQAAVLALRMKEAHDALLHEKQAEAARLQASLFSRRSLDLDFRNCRRRPSASYRH
jgi:hypothetical protein